MESRAVSEGRSPGETVRRQAQHGPLDQGGDEVERAEEVPELDGGAEDCDCCTREIVAWHLELRCRADEAITLVERAAAVYAIEPGELVLGTDNGSAFTARRFRETLSQLGIRHRRGGYRDPESQAFIESWFGKLKEREVWLNGYETLEDARRGIAGYVDRYHHRPHSGLGYRTADEVRRTREDQQRLQEQAA